MISLICLRLPELGAVRYQIRYSFEFKGPEIPNAFSPNGDGINDVWRIKYLEFYSEATVQIFNRYGQLVYLTTGYNVPWDGNFKGTPLPVGTYYYIINPKNGREIMKGSVTIVR